MTAGCVGCFVICLIIGIINAIIEAIGQAGVATVAGISNAKKHIDADNGDGKAQFELGLKYYNGDGIIEGDSMNEPDYKKALEYFKKAAENGYPEAQHNIGVMYAHGQGVEADAEIAFKWYKKAAENGMPTSQYLVGDCYLEGRGTKQNIEQAMRWFKESKEKGDKDAKKIYNYLTENNFEELVEDSNNGDSKAQSKLAFVYSLGVAKGIFSKQHGLGEQFKWDKAAAEQDNPESQFSLASDYEIGIGTEKNQKEAIKWLRKSARNGYKEAQYQLGIIYKEGKGIEPDDEEAFELFKKASDQGHTNAKLEIAGMYRNGIGVRQDYSKAIELFRELAEEDEVPEAQFQLAISYGDSKPKKALYWLNKAVENGNANAQCFLGILYSSGQLVEQDHTQAYNLISQAAAQGHKEAKQIKAIYDKAKTEEAMQNIGNFIEGTANFIDGTANGIATAKSWYRKIFH